MAVVTIAALTLTIVGLAAAQLTANQPYNNTGTTQTIQHYAGSWGWIDNCFDFRSNQPLANHHDAPQTSTRSLVPAPLPRQLLRQRIRLWTLHERPLRELKFPPKISSFFFVFIFKICYVGHFCYRC